MDGATVKKTFLSLGDFDKPVKPADPKPVPPTATAPTPPFVRTMGNPLAAAEAQRIYNPNIPPMPPAPVAAAPAPPPSPVKAAPAAMADKGTTSVLGNNGPWSTPGPGKTP